MGKTSAFMSKYLREWYPSAEILTVTANTGQEDPRSIQFGKNVDRYLGLNVKLVEAVVHPEHNAGTTHRLVTWDGAYYGFDIWESVVRKFGIFNPGKFLHCTREMKARPIRSYLRSLGLRPWEYSIAVGIRYDEDQRIDVSPDHNFIYPLFRNRITKQDVEDEVSDWPFSLDIPARKGNCLACPKKSPKKTLLNLQESPSVFAEVERLEREYGMVKQKIDEPRHFFRGKKTVSDLRAELSVIGPIDPRIDQTEQETGCAEQCTPFAG